MKETSLDGGLVAFFVENHQCTRSEQVPEMSATLNRLGFDWEALRSEQHLPGGVEVARVVFPQAITVGRVSSLAEQYFKDSGHSIRTLKVDEQVGFSLHASLDGIAVLCMALIRPGNMFDFYVT